jgi:hypothetical protein
MGARAMPGERLPSIHLLAREGSAAKDGALYALVTVERKQQHTATPSVKKFDGCMGDL